MALTLYNTLTRQHELFTPLTEGVVRMYACGPTVYDYTHIGHIRKYVGDDIIRRTCAYLGYEVRHVMNITDVGHLTDDSDLGDDKLQSKALREGKTVWDIAAFYTEYFHTSMRAVNVLPPTIESKATEHIDAMIELVKKLIINGHAYETAQAVYFDVASDPSYGVLAKQKLEDKKTAARDDVVEDQDKRNPADFALWFKRVGRFTEHTMYWPSPWGDGFPGWHIECSAMSMQYLGPTIDIHTGGIDHIPVHHENEIAQSECATGHQFVKYWVHHDFLLVDGEKMSKSKQNFYTIEDIKSRGIDPLAVRLLVMQTSYRKPLNFTWESLEQAEQSLQKIGLFVKKYKSLLSDNQPTSVSYNRYKQSFIDAISQDFNMAIALATVWEVLETDTLSLEEKINLIVAEFDQVLGLDLMSIPALVITDEAQMIVRERNQARVHKDFARSDELRTKLEALGYNVKDTADGTVLE